MAYTVYRSDGEPITILPGTINNIYYNPAGGSDGDGLGIRLVGRNTLNYGAAVAQNFVQMLENFASTNVPTDGTSVQGQLWFNRLTGSTGNLYVRLTNNKTGGLANWGKILVADSTGNYDGNANSANTLKGGGPGAVVYQSAIDTTAFLPAGQYGFALTATGPGGAPQWSRISTLGGGAPGELLYQSATNETSFIATSVAGRVLTSTGVGSMPQWAAPTSVASNINGGTTGSIVYQSAPNVTGFLAPGAAGRVLTSTGTSSAPTWTVAPAGVSSVSVSGGSTGLTTSGGPITTAGTITLAGTLNVASGGSGVTSISGIIKGNGTGPYSPVGAADIVATLGATPVSNAVNANYAANSGTASYATSSGNSLGDGQNWGDYTGSRAANVTYTNSTGRTIIVTVAVRSGNGGPASFGCSAVVNGFLVSFENAYSENPGYILVTSVVVPPSSTYSIVPSYQGTPGYILRWTELR